MAFGKKCRFTLCFITVCVTLFVLSHTQYDITGLQKLWHDTLDRSLLNRSRTFNNNNNNNNNMALLQQVYEERKELARMECKNHPVKSSDFFRNMYYDDKTRSLYCAVPKIGSSMWKRLFLVVHKNQTRDPFSKSGLGIHTSRDLKKLSLARIPAKKRPQVVRKAFAFMFSRHPFHRFFSAYCDKVFMLSHETTKLVTFMRNVIREVEVQRQRGRATNDTLKAFVYTGPELNVTFAETLAHAAKSRDFHFVNISTICRPCDIDFQVLGKMDTLDTDSRYILAKLNRSHVMEEAIEGDAFKESRDQSIIRELVERVFEDLLEKPEGTTKFKALARSWKVLHMRGLVKDDIQFPLGAAGTENATASDVIKLGIQAMQASGKPAERLAQREKYYQQAFRSVPLADLLSFRASVLSDCKIFGYDCYPSEIFHGRRDGDEEDNIFSNDKYIYKGLL
ncbi:hypothetical protein RRG08_034661 [Elysia crispata]|uniref:Carbohydrate sulfotransferase n=1 Tax=Elysia crispata TaxID=231223 RepID=A0AAE1D834_9GAST|nr:hypothetical protein RRG08_034661 [Elysia crispata]